MVRVNDRGSEHVVDIRSKSRVGSSDVGKNTERMCAFIKELDAVLTK